MAEYEPYLPTEREDQLRAYFPEARPLKAAGDFTRGIEAAERYRPGWGYFWCDMLPYGYEWMDPERTTIRTPSGEEKDMLDRSVVEDSDLFAEFLTLHPELTRYT